VEWSPLRYDEPAFRSSHQSSLPVEDLPSNAGDWRVHPAPCDLERAVDERHQHGGLVRQLHPLQVLRLTNKFHQWPPLHVFDSTRHYNMHADRLRYGSHILHPYSRRGIPALGGAHLVYPLPGDVYKLSRGLRNLVVIYNDCILLTRYPGDDRGVGGFRHLWILCHFQLYWLRLHAFLPQRDILQGATSGRQIWFDPPLEGASDRKRKERAIHARSSQELNPIINRQE